MTKKISQEDIKKLIEEGGNDSTLSLLEKIVELEDKIDEMEDKLEKEPPENDLVEKAITKAIARATLLEKGDKGDSPTEEELVSLIKPLIPEPIPGKDYILTEQDKSQIAQKIKVPVIEKIIEKTEVIKEQPIITNEIKEVAVSDTPEQIVQKIKDDSLEISVIKGLKDKLSELENRLSNIPRGGGTSAIGVAQTFKYIAHTEQPTGSINGINTIYTVRNNIFWIAGFTLNGEQIAELPNFTYSGRTITFSSALPADYSGKDFEIKYIGI